LRSVISCEGPGDNEPHGETLTRFAILVVALVTLNVAAPRATGAQVSQTFCVVPKDTSWRPVVFGFETENQVVMKRGSAIRRFYPIIRNVLPGSPADSAGIRD